MDKLLILKYFLFYRVLKYFFKTLYINLSVLYIYFFNKFIELCIILLYLKNNDIACIIILYKLIFIYRINHLHFLILLIFLKLILKFYYH